MLRGLKRIGLVLSVLSLLVGVVHAQDSLDVDHKRAWKPLYDRHGLEITYLFYRVANNMTNGVVLKLANKNPYGISYSFKLVFRSDELEKEERVVGTLRPGESVTGSSSGMFWLPFDEDHSITQLGMRDIVVTPVPQTGTGS